MFWVLFAQFFLAFSEVPLNPVFKETKTPIPKQFGLKFYFCLGTLYSLGFLAHLQHMFCFDVNDHVF